MNENDCVFYEMIAFKPPFNGLDMDSIYKKICKG